MWWVVATVALAVTALLVTYATWVAGRVDRSHARAAAAQAALDAHLVRRAAAVAAAADAARDNRLRSVARSALEAGADDREAAENDLTRVLRDRLAGGATLNGGRADVVGASRRVALARQLHNDLVRDALALRRRRMVRLFRLARKYPEPTYFDIDDPVTAGG